MKPKQESVGRIEVVDSSLRGRVVRAAPVRRVADTDGNWEDEQTAVDCRSWVGETTAMSAGTDSGFTIDPLESINPLESTIDPLESIEPYPPPSRRRYLSRGLAIVVLAGVGLVGWQVAERWSERANGPKYAAVAVSRADVASKVTATGSISPVVQVQVGSQVSGRIKEIFVDFNSPVTAGQVIATLDPEVFESAVAQAEARVAAALANRQRAGAISHNASRQHKRIRALAKQGIVAGAEVDGSLADRRSSAAEVNAAVAEHTLAEAALREAQANLAYTKIVSPISGVVVSRNVEVGQSVAVSLQAQTLFVLAEDLRKMEVHAAVAESDIGRLTSGTRARFTVDAFPERTFEGVVKQLRNAPQTESDVVTYDAVVSVSNDTLELRPGMTASITFILEEHKDVIVVPTRALRYRPPDADELDPPGGKQAAPKKNKSKKGSGDAEGVVWVLRDGKPSPVQVQPGLTDGQNTEVVGGEIREGDMIITGVEGKAKGKRKGKKDRPAGDSAQ